MSLDLGLPRRRKTVRLSISPRIYNDRTNWRLEIHDLDSVHNSNRCAFDGRQRSSCKGILLMSKVFEYSDIPLDHDTISHFGLLGAYRYIFSNHLIYIKDCFDRYGSPTVLVVPDNVGEIISRSQSFIDEILEEYAIILARGDGDLIYRPSTV